MRAVLVIEASGMAGLYRQTQWMAEVRRRPEAASLTKRYFELDEKSYVQVLERLRDEPEGASPERVRQDMRNVGAIEITS